MKKLVFSKTIVFDDIQVGETVDIRQGDGTESITDDDITNHAPFTDYVIQNKTSAAAITDSIVRVTKNEKPGDFVDVPANNGTAIAEDELFEILKLKNLDGTNAVGEVIAKIVKYIEV